VVGFELIVTSFWDVIEGLNDFEDRVSVNA
jgi:hypothetical protein